MPLTNQTLEQLATFGRMPESTIVKQLIEHRKAEALQQLLTADKAEALFKLQGQIAALDGLLNDISGARKSLERSLGSTRPPTRQVDWNQGNPPQ